MVSGFPPSPLPTEGGNRSRTLRPCAVVRAGLRGHPCYETAGRGVRPYARPCRLRTARVAGHKKEGKCRSHVLGWCGTFPAILTPEYLTKPEKGATSWLTGGSVFPAKEIGFNSDAGTAGVVAQPCSIGVAYGTQHHGRPRARYLRCLAESGF